MAANVLEAWELPSEGAPIWEEGHGMVRPENFDSGHSNSQLDTRSGGYRHTLHYLLIYLALR